MEGYDLEREGLQNECPDQPSLHPPLILSLPEEIIVHISLEACKPFYESESSIRAVQLVKPLFLGKICKQWRQIVMSTQELWKFILIATIGEPSKRGGLKNEAQIEHFKTCIDRSGNYPLFVQLESDSYHPDPYLFHNIHDLLQLCSRRIVHFSCLELPSLDETLGELNFPSLTSLAFEGYDWWWCLSGKDSASLLRSISLSYLLLSTDDLKWEGLSGLRLGRCRWTTCFKDLCLARNLVYCHFHDLDSLLDEFEDDDSMAQLSHLSTLVMSNISYTMVMAVLDRIETPALKRLEVRWDQQLLEPLTSIANLATRSSCSLDQLGITVQPVDDARVTIGCLDSIPNLSRLEFYLTGADANDVINHLYRTAHPLDIVMNRLSFPNLHQVIVEIPLLSDYKALFDDIDERRATTALEQWRSITNFKVVRLIIDCDNILENIEAYKEVFRHGLIFTVPSIHSETC